jgi:hypothetical protein
MLRKIQKEIWCWLWGHHKSFFCCQNLHTYFYCEELVVKALGHVSKSSSCVPKSNANGFTCHPFIGGQNHRVIGDACFGFLCYNLFWLMDVRVWTWHICSCHYFHKLIVGTLSCDSGTFWSHWYDWICNGNVRIAYVKDEVGNMSTFAQTLILMVRYVFLALKIPWQTSHYQQNMTICKLAIILMFVLVFSRLVWRPHNGDRIW